jgi:nucleoside-triphosphatase THEP1
VLIVLSGPIGCGKTTLCSGLVALACERDIPLGGVLTPPLVEHGKKVGIEAIDLHSGERRLLARNDRDLGGLRVGQYTFDERTMAWMASLCERALTPDNGLADSTLVFVDEIGRLELNRGQGLARLIPLFSRPRAGRTVVIVRDTLLAKLVSRVRPAKPHVVTLDARQRAIARAEMESLLLSSSCKES